MAQQRDPEDLDRDRPLTDDETTRGLDEDEFDDDDADDEDAEDEDELDAAERITGEVGDEGGSPGESVRTREPRGPAKGSEATETVKRQP